MLVAVEFVGHEGDEASTVQSDEEKKEEKGQEKMEERPPWLVFQKYVELKYRSKHPLRKITLNLCEGIDRSYAERLANYVEEGIKFTGCWISHEEDVA